MKEIFLITAPDGSMITCPHIEQVLYILGAEKVNADLAVAMSTDYILSEAEYYKSQLKVYFKKAEPKPFRKFKKEIEGYTIENVQFLQGSKKFTLPAKGGYSEQL